MIGYSIILCELTGRTRVFEGDAAAIRSEADKWARAVPGCRVHVMTPAYTAVAPEIVVDMVTTD